MIEITLRDVRTGKVVRLKCDRALVMASTEEEDDHALEICALGEPDREVTCDLLDAAREFVNSPEFTPEEVKPIIH